MKSTMRLVAEVLEVVGVENSLGLGVKEMKAFHTLHTLSGGNLIMRIESMRIEQETGRVSQGE